MLMFRLFTHVVRNFGRENDGKFHHAGHFAVFKPRGLVDQFFHSVLFHGIGIRFTRLHQPVNNFGRTLAMAAKKAFAD